MATLYVYCITLTLGYDRQYHEILNTFIPYDYYNKHYCNNHIACLSEIHKCIEMTFYQDTYFKQIKELLYFREKHLKHSGSYIQINSASNANK